MNDSTLTYIFEIFRLIISNNQFNESQYNYIYNKKWWIQLLNQPNLIHEIIIILHYNYNNFVNFIKKIDKKIDIIGDIIQLLLVINYTDSKLDDFFYDLWFIN